MCVLTAEKRYALILLISMGHCVCESHSVSMNVHRVPYDFHLIHLVGGNRSRNLLFMISQLVIGAKQPNDDAN